MTVLRMRIACWIPKATDTYSEHVIVISFPPRQWLHEHSFFSLFFTMAPSLIETN